MAKLLIIIFLFGALVDGLASSNTEPPLLIDASQPASPGLDATN